MRLSLRQGLVLSLIGAQALTAGAIGYVGRQRTQSLVTDAARAQIRNVVQLVAGQTTEYLLPAERITDTMATVLSSGNVAASDDAALERLMVGLIASQPDVSGIELGVGRPEAGVTASLDSAP